jgi:putative ABC transport system substrate-binding protein
VILEYRFAAGDLSRLPALAAELSAIPVDMLLASSVAIPYAIKAAGKIPIVMTFAADDPVEEGWVASLAHPGGNVTGITLHASELAGKRLELLKASVPALARVAILAHRSGVSGQIKAAESAAQALGLRPLVYGVEQVSEFEKLFAAMKQDRANGILMLASSALISESPRIAKLATKYRLPMISPFRNVAEDGGLMAYGPVPEGLWASAVPSYVERILKGASPADLPVEQPTQFELTVNMKTAKVLGLKIPRSVLVRTDRVIE